MISVKIIALPEAMIRLRERGPQIIEAITVKMNELMLRLQAKVIGESIPTFFKSAPNIASTVQMIPAHVEGTVIVGAVQAGGPKTTKITLKSGAEVDYAAVQEYGVDHGWDIYPGATQRTFGTALRTNDELKKVLSFMLDGKRIFAAHVFHPPLEARPFLRSELQNMETEIIAGLESVFRETLGA